MKKILHFLKTLLFSLWAAIIGACVVCEIYYIIKNIHKLSPKKVIRQILYALLYHISGSKSKYFIKIFHLADIIKIFMHAIDFII